MTAYRSRIGGYTLVELLVVLGILGVLTSLAMPMVEITVQRQKEKDLKRALWEIRDAIDAYHSAVVSGAMVAAPSSTGYPPSLQSLTQAHKDIRASSSGQVLRFLRRVPRDPFAEPSLPPEATWGLRSYMSEASNPQAGADVYDVYSRAKGNGLNGMALSQW